MKKCRMVLTALLSVLALGSPAFQFAQSPSASTANVNRQDSDHASLMGLIRTINTLEVTDFYQYGSYSSWQTLLEHHEKDLNGWVQDSTLGKPMCNLAECRRFCLGGVCGCL
jgi:hypothetical protein